MKLMSKEGRFEHHRAKFRKDNYAEYDIITYSVRVAENLIHKGTPIH